MNHPAPTRRTPHVLALAVSLALALALIACKGDPPAPGQPAQTTSATPARPAQPAALVIASVQVGGMVTQPLVQTTSAALREAIGKTEGVSMAPEGASGATLDVDVSAQATPISVELPPRLTVRLSATVRDASGQATALRDVIAERDVPLTPPGPGESREAAAKAQEAKINEALSALTTALTRALVQTRALAATPDADLPALLATPDLEDFPTEQALMRVRESKLTAAYPAAQTALKRATSPRVILAAAATLALGDHKPAEAALLDAAERLSRDHQRTAHLALINLLPRVGGPPTRQYLSALAQSGANPEVQRAATDALKRMDRPTAGGAP